MQSVRLPLAIPSATVARGSAYYALDSAWDQCELGSALDVGAPSVIGELNPSGANGVLLEVLGLFAKSLDLLDELRERGSAVGIKFEAPQAELRGGADAGGEAGHGL